MRTLSRTHHRHYSSSYHTCSKHHGSLQPLHVGCPPPLAPSLCPCTTIPIAAPGTDINITRTPACAAPPEECHYDVESIVKDACGCSTNGCGNLVCATATTAVSTCMQVRCTACSTCVEVLLGGTGSCVPIPNCVLPTTTVPTPSCPVGSTYNACGHGTNILFVPRF